MEKNLKSDKLSPTSKSLLDISEIMSNCSNYVKLSNTFREWDRQSEEGNRNSQKLVDILYIFEKLIKTITQEVKIETVDGKITSVKL